MLSPSGSVGSVISSGSVTSSVVSVVVSVVVSDDDDVTDPFVIVDEPESSVVNSEPHLSVNFLHTFAILTLPIA